MMTQPRIDFIKADALAYVFGMSAEFSIYPALSPPEKACWGDGILEAEEFAGATPGEIPDQDHIEEDTELEGYQVPFGWAVVEEYSCT